MRQTAAKRAAVAFSQLCDSAGRQQQQQQQQQQQYWREQRLADPLIFRGGIRGQLRWKCKKCCAKNGGILSTRLRDFPCRDAGSQCISGPLKVPHQLDMYTILLDNSRFTTWRCLRLPLSPKGARARIAGCPRDLHRIAASILNAAREFRYRPRYQIEGFLFRNKISKRD
ncbi:hypothetical protein HN011_009187 [Eciton burchellii]|nr:hypothetical protein HN011_009187 [Eciton burchellii]